MKIGVDFDNTIVCYDEVFSRAAVEHGLVPRDIANHKGGIRDYLRAQDKEAAWTELQGLVYGEYIKYAPPFAGVLDFFQACKARGNKLYIISHKTKTPFIGEKYDLHAAAQNWLKANGFYEPKKADLGSDKVYFELTKEAKLARIKAVGCDYYIDDLPEFLKEGGFPAGVKRILFDPNDYFKEEKALARVKSWREIGEVVL